jgi:copper chaperone
MPQMTLFAPDITCDHCIATISKAVGTVEGARFIAGDPDSRTFAVEVASGAVLDRVAETLAEEGYPLGEAPAPGASPAPSSTSKMDALPMAGAPMGGMHGKPQPGFKPQYLKIEKTDAGADVTYSCPCGSTTEVGRLRAHLGSAAEGYDIDVQTITMPWGQPVEAAQAVGKA